jgi:Beta-propeller repeat
VKSLEKNSVMVSNKFSVTASWMKAALLVAVMMAAVSVVSHFSNFNARAAKASALQAASHKKLSASALSLPLFFEPNHGQTDSRVKFLARGAGYGLFLTADEAVLQLNSPAVSPKTADKTTEISLKPRPSSVIRMRLDGANPSARVSGASPMPGKSSYFIGSDPSKWHRDIPQFARVQYQTVYPGVDLVYYGNQGQLEYDFRVAPSADPNQIALSFKGATTRIDSGDLVFSTPSGDVRFRAPHIYQPAASQTATAEKAIAGSFRQLADNKIGFTIGDYDHSRELVIDPTLSYSTYLGGGGQEGLVKIAVDSAQTIYVAGSTNSADFPLAPAGNSSLTGTQNIFISKINPLNAGTGNSQLIYSIYLGGSGVDNLAGIAVDTNSSIYVAGSTTSSDFPTLNGFENTASGSHGFLSRISIGLNLTYELAYSTYLAGNGVDTVTGLAIDQSQANAYVTGVTTSINPVNDGFPANINGFQTSSNSPGNPQFFASQINTTFTGSASMLYSTYFGGNNPTTAIAVGGGIAVDPTSSNVSMYITGTTNMLPVGLNGGKGFPLFNAQQSCLDEASKTLCVLPNPVNTDAFVAKINPTQFGQAPVYSTYVGAEGIDAGNAISVDTSGNAYITGSTNSTGWVCTGCPSAFQGALGGGVDAFIAKIINQSNSVFPLNYFTYLGGTGDDVGRDIKVDSIQMAHVVGSTTSANFPTTTNTLYPTYAGGGDAFVASILTTATGAATGNLSTYLGGSQLDQGTGVAIDLTGGTYAAGNTLSSNFPITAATAYQPNLNGGSQDAFITRIGSVSQLTMSHLTTSPSPNPVAAGAPAAFTFNIINKGPDTANNLFFVATVPATPQISSNATAQVKSGTGSCGVVTANQISCFIPTLSACVAPCTTGASVEVDVTPSLLNSPTQVSVSATVSANGGGVQASDSQIDPVVDFKVSATTTTPQINAGDTALFQVLFTPTSSAGYSATITPSQTTSPAMVTSTTPVFNPTTVILSGTAPGTTTLSIATVVRPITTGGLLRRGSFYGAWLPIGGLSLIGLGFGAGRKRRRLVIGAVFAILAAVILLQSGCGSSGSSPTVNGGTAAGNYTITITGSTGTGASHNFQIGLVVH